MPFPPSASKRIGKRRCDRCYCCFSLVRQRFGLKQFCCKACLENYLSCTTREAHRSKWKRAEFWLHKECPRSVSRVLASIPATVATPAALTAMTATAEESARSEGSLHPLPNSA